MKIYWHKLNEEAIIPTKRAEDAGFDIYTIEKEVQLEPFSKHLFSTGIQYNIEPDYFLLAFDRGSTGSKGLHVHCGVCDQGYRGEVFICISNDNSYPVLFSNEVEPGLRRDEDGYPSLLVYPTSKAIAQLIPLPLPKVDTETADDELGESLNMQDETIRGDTKLGASGK